MSTTKITYGTSTSMTCTLASLASSATVGRVATPVDNSSNLFDDVLVTIGIKTSSSALANDKAVTVYVAGSEDGTNFDSDDVVITSSTTDAGYTVNAPSNLKLAATINCPTSSKTYNATFSLARLFGGICPKKWTLVIVNYTGQALDSTEGNHQKTYTGITYTSV